jgi:outer membrane immunogenic protein
MRRLLLSGAAAAALAMPAGAADLPARMPMKGPIMPAPGYVWTGCYVGVHLGGGFGRTEFDVAGASASVDTSGFIGGGQIGCDYQWAPGWVIGVQGQAAWADITGDSGIAAVTVGGFGVATGQLHSKTDFLASATGRLGYGVDRWLLYVKGGVAFAHDKYNLDGTFLGVPFDFASDQTRTGWTAGAGLEWAFWTNWSAMLEYQYYDFGTDTINLGLTTAPAIAIPFNIRDTIHTVKAGVNFRF